jgi:hypothetical protein
MMWRSRVKEDNNDVMRRKLLFLEMHVSVMIVLITERLLMGLW